MSHAPAKPPPAPPARQPQSLTSSTKSASSPSYIQTTPGHTNWNTGNPGY